ncbi:ATP-binding protein [Nocardioides currus]|uniref:Circadian input-output histidine kinase CikA n=1 Tax=Nocardioides currus TaxID=2133958 RepID=A0A2R7YVS5_9ACTN|nr:ATP-binding protein [Nocardioides currus]PUA80462.1 hypothetical protein C7S10_15220 [Nocardioides currus]
MSDFRRGDHASADAFFQHLVETSTDGLWLIDFDGRTVYANARVAEMHGISVSELGGLSVFDVLDDRGKESFRGHLERLRAGMVEQDDEESLLVRRDGTGRWVLVSSQAVMHPTSGEPCVLLRLSDFSRRRQERDELTRAKAAFAEARDSAVAESQQKSEFLATVSHEIRTPLNGVLGLNELLLATDLDDEQRRLATGVGQSGRLLLELVSDVLDFSKVDAGRLDLEEVEFDVRVVVDQVVDPVREAAHGKGLGFSVSYDDLDHRVVRGDPTRLAQVCGNLLSNALKFTDEGRVDVVVSSEAVGEATRLRVSVVDTGIGIDGDAADVFAPFQQADSSTSRVFGGTGLGLAISRDLAEAMGGEVQFDSVVGRGTTFWFTCLVAPVDAGHAAPSTDAVRATTQVPRRVLVVEDNEVNQMVARGFLHSLGHSVETASDGLAAVALLGRDSFDLVLMDVQMPRLDGYATTRRIRSAEPAGSRIPIVAMTANAVAGERERCLSAGMDDFLTKPVDREDLARVLASWVGDKPPAVAPATRPPVLDRARLALLADEDLGGADYLGRVLGRFETGGPAMVTAIEDARTVEDLQFAAHKLAGTAANIGFGRMADVARDLEEQARGGAVRAPDALLEDLRAALGESLDALAALRS